MKRTVSSVLLWLIVLLPFAFSASAVNVPVSLFVNGGKLASAALPKMIDSEIYVQLSVLNEHLGLKTEWRSPENRAIISYKGRQVELVKGDQRVTVDGQAYDLTHALIVDSQIPYVPIRLIGSHIGVKSIWDPLTKSVSLYTQGKAAAPAQELFDRVEDIVMPAPGNAQSGTLTAIQATQSLISITSPGTGSARHFYLSDPTESLPDRIVIDLPGIRLPATGSFQGPSGELLVNHARVSKIRYSQFSDNPNTVRIVLELKAASEYQVKTDVATGLTSVTFGTTPIAKSFKVVIDAGHGGKDPGATGHSGRFEKHFTLELSQQIYAQLLDHPTIQPYLTRSDDTFIDLEGRAQIANDLDADLFVSIHGNTFESASVSGTETYYWGDDSLGIAEQIHEMTLAATGFKDREVRKNRYRVLAATEMPAVLLEIGYLTNEANERTMLDSAAQKRIAEGVATAIEEYFQ